MPLSLAEEMEDIARFSVEHTLEDASDTQKLYMTTASDERIVALLAVGPGTEIARAARLMVYMNEPVTAVLVTEGWAVMAAPDEKDPDRLAVMRGRKKPSEIPRHKRDETLILYGESAKGERLVRMWKILTAANGIRDLAEITDPMIDFETRFWPLFVIENIERTIQSDLIDGTTNEMNLPPEVMAEMRKLTLEMTPENRHAILRKVFGQMLAQGAGGTSRQWEERRGRHRR